MNQTNEALSPPMTEPQQTAKRRALTYTEMMNSGTQQFVPEADQVQEPEQHERSTHDPVRDDATG